MATVIPEREALRRAIKWISAHLETGPETPVQRLVSEAVTRFDLSPKDADFLAEFYRKAKAQNPSELS